MERTASAKEIQRAYRRLAHQYHPDVSGQSDDGERFKVINSAYELLSDPQRRAEFDRLYHAGDEYAPRPRTEGTSKPSSTRGPSWFSEAWPVFAYAAATVGVELVDYLYKPSVKNPAYAKWKFWQPEFITRAEADRREFRKRR